MPATPIAFAGSSLPSFRRHGVKLGKTIASNRTSLSRGAKSHKPAARSLRIRACCHGHCAFGHFEIGKFVRSE